MYRIVISLIVLLSLHSQAQNVPLLHPVFPQPGQNSVAISSSIVIRAPTAIDARSVTVQSPDAEISGWRPTEPTIMVVRESIAQRTDPLRLSEQAIIGRTEYVDQRTLRWTPAMLMENTTYRCIVRGVVLDQRAGGRMCAPLEFTFRTAADVPRIAATTFDTIRVLPCSRDLFVQFTEPLPFPGLIDQVVIPEQLHHDGTWKPLESARRLSDDRRKIVISPRGSWPTSASIRLRCMMSTLTGDDYDDRTESGIVRGASTVTLSVEATDGRPIPEQVQAVTSTFDRVLHHGTPLVATIPAQLPDHWRFVRWECKDLPQVNGKTSHRLDETIPCHLYSETISIKAIVEHIDTINVAVTIDSGGTMDVYDQDGRHLGHIATSGSIGVTTSTTSISCVATPSAHHTFSAWNSALPSINGSIAASIVIPTKSLKTVPGTYINPRFTPLNPQRTEMFRLVARTADADPDETFNVADGVAFTTEDEFEDVVEGQRTICVQASRCWEIIGYHDPSSGPLVWFDGGRADLCLTSKLLDPENNVVIYARRKQIELRLERVLLGSEDPNNILVGRQPHPETRVDVELRKRINGQYVWQPMSQITCSQGAHQYGRYAFKCGDNIRFVVRAATKRGEEWRWWSRLDRYAIPAVENITDKVQTYTMVVDFDMAQFDGMNCLGQPTGLREIRTQAAFRQYFGIASIGLRVRGNAKGERHSSKFEERWYDPATYFDLDPDEPRSGRHLEYVARKGTSVKLKFTMPIDGPSVLAGGISAESVDNILVTDPHATGLDFTVTTGPNGNTNFLPTNGQSADIVEFFICDPTTTPIKQALHGGLIDITCTTGLMSASGEHLRNSHLFSLRRMELPGLGLRLREAEFAYDGDWDFWPFENDGEVYHAMYGADLAQDAALLTTQGFARIPDCGQQQGAQGECTTEHSDKGAPLNFGDKVVWLQTAWMGESDLAWWSMSSWDEDCKDENDCLVNRLGDVIDAVKKRTEQYGSTGSKKDLDWKTILPDIVKTGVDIIAALLPPDEQDEPLGEASFLEDRQNLWGMRSAIAPRIEARHENVTYRLRGQWFVSRAVVR
ncbi:MAG: hypothetical protein KBB72_02505 [Candidatus Kapabacteria bacterium]|nr:hypothetical protein [Candidatus Kapabacteria bacterium]